MGIIIDNDVKNQKSTPALYSDVFANIPAFGQTGRLFFATDTNIIYRDNGSAWVIFLSQVSIPAGLSPIGTAGQYIKVNAGATALEYFTFNSSTVTTALGYTPVGGTGTAGTLALFTASGTIGNSALLESATYLSTTKKVAIGPVPGSTYMLEVDGGINVATGHEYRKNGVDIFNTTSNGIPKFNNTSKVFVNSNITDDGTSIFINSQTAIGNATVSGTTFDVSLQPNASNFIGIRSATTLTVSGTTGSYFQSVASSGAITFTNLNHYYAFQSTFGSTITNQFGFRVDSTLIGGTNNYGFYGDIASGTNRWNFYANGTAFNYFNGTTLIGSATDNSSGAKLQVTGSITYQNTFNRQTASYTLALTDQNDIVEMNVATANNLTVPLNSTVAFPIGTEIAIAQYGAGKTTIVATGGVTLRSAGGLLSIGAQYAMVSLVKVGTNEWYVVGNLIA